MTGHDRTGTVEHGRRTVWRPAADRIDDAFSQGWSVLVRGPARRVSDAEEVRRLSAWVYSTPWAGGDRDLWVRIEPSSVTGRRITV